MNRKIIQAFELEGNGNPLQYPCLGNPMDRGAWRATAPEIQLCKSTILQKKRKGYTKVPD